MNESINAVNSLNINLYLIKDNKVQFYKWSNLFIQNYWNNHNVINSGYSESETVLKFKNKFYSLN